MPVSVLVLTEDSGDDAFPTVRALLEKTLHLVAPGGRHVPWEVLPATKEARRAMHFNRWKSRAPRDHRLRVDLVKAVATHLTRADGDRFVVIHVDGDRRWSDSVEGTECDNIAQLNETIIERLRLRLEDESALGRVLVVVPFYSIEAWVYQNTEEAIRILEEKFGPSHADIALFRGWEENRAAIDDVERPKQKVALGAKYNRRLAEKNWPAKRAYEAGTSYHKTVEDFRKCRALIQALSGTGLSASSSPRMSALRSIR